jgi:hypothetical protein
MILSTFQNTTKYRRVFFPTKRPPFPENCGGKSSALHWGCLPVTGSLQALHSMRRMGNGRVWVAAVKGLWCRVVTQKRRSLCSFTCVWMAAPQWRADGYSAPLVASTDVARTISPGVGSAAEWTQSSETFYNFRTHPGKALSRFIIQKSMSATPAPQLARDDARALCAPSSNLNGAFLQFDTAHEGELISETRGF